jgi:DNA-binding SARP family transcriptional activator/pimeloyl-ACP methyl ester carboxylesterase
MAQAGAPSFQLFLLGGFKLHAHDGLAIDRLWRHRKAKALLKLLALQPNRAAHREAVIEALWPDSNPGTGANNLHQTLFRIRRKVGDQTIVALRGDMVALSPDLWIDVEAFRAACIDPQAQADVARCERALSIYGGPLLPEDTYEDWTADPRDQLAALYRALLLHVAGLQASAGDFAGAERRLRDAIASDHLDEEANSRLMRLLDAAGELRRALAQYRSFQSALREELGVEPSEATTALAEKIRAEIASGAAEPPVTPLDVRYVRSRDGTSISYTAHAGSNGIPLVLLPVLPWGHLQVEWNIAKWRAWVTRFAPERAVIRYNLRGAGMSQLEVNDVSLDRQVEDLEAVVDALGLARFALFAAESAGPISIAYAVKHPERVSHLLFYYAWADGPRYAAGFEISGIRQMMQSDWDLYLGAMAYAANAPDEEVTPLMQDWASKSTSREMLLRYWDAITPVDVTPLLRSVRASSAVLSKRSIKGFNTEHHMRLALDLIREIPAGRVIEVDGEAYHFIAGDFEPLTSAIDDFLNRS